MNEKCSVCERRQGLLSTECRTLHPVGEELCCEQCLTTLAALALRLTLPDARGVAAVITREIMKPSVQTAGDAEQVRARMVAAAFLPDVLKAVEATVRVVEGSPQVVAEATRDILQALIHTKHLPTAKRYVEGETKKKGA